jgi:hypothetical protein
LIVEIPHNQVSEREKMSQFTWPAFMGKHKDLHLVVVELPIDASKDPWALVDPLVKLVKPKGDFALSAERTAMGARLFCAFAEPTDADMMVEATNAQEDNIYSGWASEYHCRLNRTEAAAICGTNHGA